MRTLIVLRYLQVGDLQFRHGEELPPNLLPQEAVDLHLDRRELVEYDANERRSLYRLLHHFTDCAESERLGNPELAEYALTS